MESPREGLCPPYVFVESHLCQESILGLLGMVVQVVHCSSSTEQVALNFNPALYLPSYMTWWEAAIAQTKRAFFRFT